MRRISAHESNEIPIFGVRRGINHQIRNQSGIGMRRSGKSYRNLQILVMDVIVNGTGNTVDRSWNVIL